MFLIEHNGSLESTKKAREFSDLLEVEFGYSSEQEIGDEQNLVLTKIDDSGELLRVASFDSVPSAEKLRMYLSFL